MHTLSRHLPPLQTGVRKIPHHGKVILLGTLALVGYWFYSSPLNATIGFGSITLFVAGSMIIEGRRVARIRQDRDDTIGDFRRSFDLRQIDPWIIRATYEAFGAWFDAKQSKFPLRASDLIYDDFKIDWEDLDDLLREVAQRAGYDISRCEANPLYGNVRTVEDFVKFVTHQPKINKAEQDAPSNR